MILPLLKRLVVVLQDAVGASAKVVYGYPRTLPKTPYVVIGAAEAEIDLQRFAPGRAAQDEAWQIELQVFSQAHYASPLVAVEKVDDIAQSVLTTLADNNTLTTSTEPKPDGLRYIVATDYSLTTADDAANGLIAAATLSLTAYIKAA